jgi:hypothetical protein
MIVIRADQTKAMADASRDRFQRKLSEQLGAPPAEVAAQVDAAHAQGLTRQRDVAQFVEEALRSKEPAGTTSAGSVAEDYSRFPVGGTTMPCQQKHYVEIELLGEDDRPVPGEEYRITLPDGRVVTGQLNVLGKAYVPDIPDLGNCQITFPALDNEAWEPLVG